MVDFAYRETEMAVTIRFETPSMQPACQPAHSVTKHDEQGVYATLPGVTGERMSELSLAPCQIGSSQSKGLPLGREIVLAI